MNNSSENNDAVTVKSRTKRPIPKYTSAESTLCLLFIILVSYVVYNYRNA
jgi:hypothetical protein